MTRRLNGPQTTGRTFRQLSEPVFGLTTELDMPVDVRDGTCLLADVFRPAAPGERFPALVAFSAYPRQMQQSGLPMGFVEAGATDFWVARGYGHVIVNARGTGGSGGTYTMMDSQERADLHDTIEWVAAQDWCDGRVGMIGVSYFGMAQLAAAVEAPPSLKAVFPFAAASSVHQTAYHGDILSDLFFGGWLAGVAMFSSKKRSDMFRSKPAQAIAKLLNAEPVHRRFEHFDGEAAIGSMGKLMRLKYDAEPWEQLYQAATTEHPRYDDFWCERDCVPLLDRARVPMHLGCPWDNVALHLSGVFTAWEARPAHPGHRVSLLEVGGLSWPWETMHTEALAWYDCWLKDRDTGALDGPPIRYWLRGADEYRTLDAWPPPDLTTVELHLRADGTLGAAADGGGRDYLFTPPALTRPANKPASPLPTTLAWDTEAATTAYDVVGGAQLALDAASTAADVDWIAKLSLVDGAGTPSDLTQGWLRVRDPEHARVQLVPTAIRVRPGERLRLTLTSSDREEGMAMSGFTHLPLASPSRQHVRASSHLVLPLLRQ